MNITARRAGTAVAALALTSTGLAVTSAPASAAPGDCPRGYACLWPNTGWTGSRWQGQYANATLPAWINNNAESTVNNGRDCAVRWYFYANYQSPYFTQNKGTQLSDLGDYWNNDIMSMNWIC